MRTSREMTDTYAEKGGHALRRFHFACIANGSPRILEETLSSPSFRKDQETIFCGDLPSAFHALNFVWAQAWAVAVGAGVPEKAADRIYDRFIQRAKEVRTVPQILELHSGLLLAYAKAVEEIKSVPRYSLSVQKCCHYVSEHLNQPLSVQQIADSLGLSASYLSHCFKEETGQTLVAYIQQAKIAAARLLLLRPDQTIGTVMEQLGFISQSHFSKLFKAQTGKTPGKYRSDAKAGTGSAGGPTSSASERSESMARWYEEAENYGQTKGLELQAYLFNCIRRGKVAALVEQFGDAAFMEEMDRLFGENLDRAIETYLCLWPQAAHAATDSGLDAKASAAFMHRYISDLYACLSVQEAMELNRRYFLSLAEAVSAL